MFSRIPSPGQPIYLLLEFSQFKNNGTSTKYHFPQSITEKLKDYRAIARSASTANLKIDFHPWL
ncbi:hypothetical protein IQ238_24490 [Pleurocapsales cyanobacterium LEGE 06147]|nr:hypothetical protein [Pleurocapsales cyanobacterium LEGE 06147]